MRTVSPEGIMKQFLVNYYADTSQYYGTYHNHKEISAWAGLALHVLFCGLAIRADIPANLRLITTTALTVSVLLVGLFAFRYIKNQLEMKDRAGALAGAAGILLVEILRTDETKLNPDDYLRVIESSDTKAQSSHVLPDRLLKKADVLNTRGRGFQDRTRSMIYSLLALSTVAVIGLKWIVTLGQ